MNELNDAITKMVDILGRLNGLPGYALVFLLCLGMGFLLKTVTRFPNDAIPLAVVLMGAIFNSLIADTKADNIPFRLWIFKNAIVGAIVGLCAWGIHKNRYRIPILKNFFKPEDQTGFINKSDVISKP